ncbi:hypothetical protein AVEN_193435-1 [Araneus ventricosus]|uniref:Uncharacterized protein n=1 Tax=Araneus ventricosus TaxID=182803 RepID=A0A4Y2G801_ARAVE|nr:hypothetical protein AVEN_193435-1 [Araneus ventricosus]
MKIRHVWGLLHVKSYVVAKRPPADVVRKFGEGMSAQVLPSPSGRGSNLRSRSQNSPRVASKRDVNITKLNWIYSAFKLQNLNIQHTENEVEICVKLLDLEFEEILATSTVNVEFQKLDLIEIK